MKMKLSIVQAIIWTAAIFASALLHGPLDLTLILTMLAFTAVMASEERASAEACTRPTPLTPDNR